MNRLISSLLKRKSLNDSKKTEAWAFILGPGFAIQNCVN